MKLKISACLVIYNEGKVLRRCLESLEDVVEEIIIVHDGECKDKSLKIAREFGAKVYIREHIGEAEYHRPFAFNQAKGDWILHIDADEFLSKRTRQEISKLIKSKECDAYAFRWPLWLLSKKCYISSGAYGSMFRASLFRKSKMYMFGIAHAHPQSIGKYCKREDLIVEHKPQTFSFSFEGLKTKIIPWARIEASQILNWEKTPYFGRESRMHVSKKYKFIVNHPILSGILAVIERKAWFFKNNGIFSEFINYEILFFDLLRIFLTHWFILIYKYRKSNSL